MTYAKHHVLIPNKSQKKRCPILRRPGATARKPFSLLRCLLWDGWSKHGCPFADQISPPIPSPASPKAQSYTDGPLKWALDYGTGPSGMPGSKGTLSDDELWSIVVFLRRLLPLGSQATPDMYTH